MDQPSRPVALTIEVSFETTRLSSQCLIEAYDRLVSIQRRRLRPTRDPELGDGQASIVRENEHV
jgi:hypothetical protein